MVKMTYSASRSFAIQQVMAKIGQTPTTAAKAGAIRKVLKGYQEGTDKVQATFMKEVAEKFAEKDEHGAFMTEEGGGYKIPEAKKADFQHALEEFGARELKLDVHPLNASMLEDMRVTAQELDALGGLYTDENGPGVPHMSAVR